MDHRRQVPGFCRAPPHIHPVSVPAIVLALKQAASQQPITVGVDASDWSSYTFDCTWQMQFCVSSGTLHLTQELCESSASCPYDSYCMCCI